MVYDKGGENNVATLVFYLSLFLCDLRKTTCF